MVAYLVYSASGLQDAGLDSMCHVCRAVRWHLSLSGQEGNGLNLVSHRFHHCAREKRGNAEEGNHCIAVSDTINTHRRLYLYEHMGDGKGKGEQRSVRTIEV